MKNKRKPPSQKAFFSYEKTQEKKDATNEADILKNFVKIALDKV